MLEDLVALVEKDRKNKTNFIDNLVDAYLAGDLDEMMTFATSPGGEPSEAEKRFMKKLLDERNTRMTNRLLARMKERPGKIWFVAVGSAHHHGKIGMPQLLRDAGYTVTRVPAPSGG